MIEYLKNQLRREPFVVQENDEALIITIKPGINWLVMFLLTLNLFVGPMFFYWNRDYDIYYKYLLVMLVPLALYFLWIIFGVEILTISSKGLSVYIEFFFIKRTYTYPTELIEAVSMSKYESQIGYGGGFFSENDGGPFRMRVRNSSENYSKSKTIDRIFNTRTVRFGAGLKPKEAKKVLKLIQDKTGIGSEGRGAIEE